MSIKAMYMVPSVLPSCLQIADNASSEDYVKYILPSLKPVMKMMEPDQILLIFMQRMDLLLEKTPSEDIKSDVLPMVYRALGSNVSQIQELCLSITPNFAGKILVHIHSCINTIFICIFPRIA